MTNTESRIPAPYPNAQTREAENEQEKPSKPPARSGACPFCLRKHLLKAEGYAEEWAEDLAREWEFLRMIQNLLLAEDHADALGERGLKEDVRAARLEAEAGRYPPLRALVARAQAMVAAASAGGSPVAEKKAEGATGLSAPAPAATTGEKR